MTSVVYFVVPCQTIIIVAGVVYYERAATIVCYNSSWYVFCMYTLHALEDLASAGDIVDVMR